MEALPRQEAIWLTVHTKPRQEPIAEEHLVRQGIPCFLPRAFNPQRKLKSAGPKVEALFPRYLFIEVVPGEHNISAVNYTRGVSRIVQFGGRLAHVPSWLVTRLQSMVDRVSGLVELTPPRLKPGDEVDVFDGPLAGLRAIIQQMDGDRRALLLMKMLGKEAVVGVPTLYLRPAR